MSFEAPEGWRASTLGELAENDDRLRVPLSSQERSLRQGPYPYWGANGVLDYVDEYLFDEPRVLVAEDGTVRTDDGFPVVHRPVGRYWVNNHAHVLRAKWGVDSAWFFYAISRTPVDPFLTGSVQLKLSQANMNLMPLIVPPLVEQRRIAWVLGTLDDKIELNQRLSETALSVGTLMAKESTSETTAITEVATVSRGVQAKVDENGGVPFVRGGDLKNVLVDLEACATTDPDYLDKQNAGDSIMITSIGSIGDLAYVPSTSPSVPTGNAALIKPRDSLGAALFFALNSMDIRGWAETENAGSAQPYVPIKAFKGLEASIATDREVRLALDHLLETAIGRRRENHSLAALRNDLLPKLISGKIRVPEGVGPDLDDETAQEVAEELTEA